MDDLRKALQGHGFDLDPPLNQGIYRFSRNGNRDKDCWFIGWVNYTKNNKQYIIAEYGDHSTGEEHKFNSFETDLTSTEERNEALARQRELSEQRRKERYESQERASQRAKEVWEKAGPAKADNPYLQKKKIEPIGIKEINDAGRALLIPMFDVGGKIWGIQYIFEDGKKRFLPGQRKHGCFFRFGDAGTEAFIAEGYATGNSIYTATNKTTYVAFDAGNLLEVAKSLKEKYPDRTFIICGDDDKWKQKNVGREKAELAARAINSIAIYPHFSSASLEHKPTDWNDLHCLEGIDAIRLQTGNNIGNEAKNVNNGGNDYKPHTVLQEFIKPLGHNDDDFYYTSSSNFQIIKIPVSAHSQNQFLQLMPMAFWEQKWPSDTKKAGKGVNWGKAISDLMASCRESGIFNPNKVRGVGAWNDDEKLIINLGDSLYCDGKVFGLREIESDYIYTLSENISGIPENIVSNEEAKEFLNLVESFNWKHKKYALFLGGFLVIAPFCGALKWRPHIWVTGSTGSGKSSLFDYLIRPVLSGFGESVGGNTTEAGIRQRLKASAKSVIFDEFETNDKKSNDRIKGILDFIRISSSDSESTVFKGSGSGNSVGFKPRAAFIVGSVRVNLTQDTDKNRFTILELQTSGNSPAGWNELRKKLDIITDDFPMRLISRTAKLWPVIQKNTQTFQAILGEKYNQRFGQQHGCLFAGYASLVHECVLDLDAAKTLVESVDLSDEAEVINESDDNDIVDYLLGKKVSIQDDKSRIDLAIIELIKEQREADLARIGLRVSGGFLCIACFHSELSSIFNGTKWMSGWSRSFLRKEGAEKCVVRIFGKNTKCIRMPIKSLGIDDAESNPF